MICEINIEEKFGKVHPYLGISDNGTIVLFTKKETGLCLHSESKNQIFEYSDFWEEDDFEPLKGTIKLGNE